jgi:long-subunit acyl-CoA synthetase (AMP-forming)
VRTVERVLTALRDSPLPLVETLGVDGAPAAVRSYQEVLDAAVALAGSLRGAAQVGVVADNSPEWVVSDLACLLAASAEVPVPLAFSADQAASLLGASEICLVDAAGRDRLAEWGRERVLPEGCRIVEVDLDALAAAGTGMPLPPLPAGDWVCKVVHTSGTTSAPKGVRIRADGLDALLAALREALPAHAWDRYLSLVPFSLLIEQVTAVYLTLLDGGTLVLLPPEVPLLGTAPDAVRRALPYLAHAHPGVLQGPPALFKALAGVAADHTEDATAELSRRLFGRAEPPLLACGGAPVAPEVLGALWRRGIPVYEGYGLSENGSVASMNSPTACRLGSVGRPLPHVEARVAPDGELLLRSSSLFAGYSTDEDPTSCGVDDDGWLHTGDLAEQDEDGFLYLRGRKKNVVITASGRNVAADWVASRYQALPEVQAAVVFGDDMDELVGFFVVADGCDQAAVRGAIEEYGRAHLSEVERVGRIHTIPAGDPRLAGLFTVTGRPVRERIWDLVAA